jgi:type I restriction enzyme M protein
MFEQIFKNIDDTLRKDAGCSSELDYTEQSSWLLFLKYLDDLDEDRKAESSLTQKPYHPILDAQYRWGHWAAPKNRDGDIDENKAQTGDKLKEFVNSKLFPYLKSFKDKAESSDTIHYKIGEIFSEIQNKIQNGFILRDILDLMDKLRFRSQKEKFELSVLYEAKIKRMGNAGRNGGEYYTPRPLIRAIIDVVNPRIGETVYDGAAGSAGFLCEAYNWMCNKEGLSTRDREILQKQTFYGQEKKSLAYVIAIMNMILHGIDTPNLLHANTLLENVNDIPDERRHNVILANPPFGGSERPEVQRNFNIHTSETAYLFLQHFIKKLKVGGRAGVVIKNTFLSNTDQACYFLRRELLTSCNLHTVLDMPGGTFQGAGVKTVVLFFEKGQPTSEIWYYQLDPGRSLGKTNPLNDDDMREFVELQKTFAESPKSWKVKVDPNSRVLDLAVKNPNTVDESDVRTPAEILDEMTTINDECRGIMDNIRSML